MSKSNKVVKTRRTQAERRSTTQAAILDACLQLLADEGYANFSASGVAARAGVSRGAQENYFPKRADLILAATGHAMEQAVDHARAAALTASSSPDPIDRFLADSEEFFFMPVYMAMTEIIIAARSDKDLYDKVMPTIQEAREELDGIWTDTLMDAGHSRAQARQFVELSHYLLRGVFHVSTWLPYDVDRAAVIRAWRELAPAALRLEPGKPGEPKAPQERDPVASA